MTTTFVDDYTPVPHLKDTVMSTGNYHIFGRVVRKIYDVRPPLKCLHPSLVHSPLPQSCHLNIKRTISLQTGVHGNQLLPMLFCVFHFNNEF